MQWKFVFLAIIGAILLWISQDATTLPFRQYVVIAGILFIVPFVAYVCYRIILRDNKESTKTRKPFSKTQKDKAVARQGFKCYYCEKPLDNKLLIEYHHKNKRNWDNSDGNCIAAHTYCHQGLERLDRQ
jgi:Ca2+/Na+ antiporter